MRFTISTALVQTVALFAVLASPSLGAALPRSGCATGHIKLVDQHNAITWISNIWTYGTDQLFLPVSDNTTAALFCTPTSNVNGSEIALAVSTMILIEFPSSQSALASQDTPSVYLGAGFMGFGTSDNGQLDDHTVPGALLLPMGQGELQRVNRLALTLTIVLTANATTTVVDAKWAWNWQTAAESQIWEYDSAAQTLAPQWINADGCTFLGCSPFVIVYLILSPFANVISEDPRSVVDRAHGYVRLLSACDRDGRQR